MDDAKRAEGLQLLNDVSRELETAAQAAREARAASNDAELWKHLQNLFARFDEASQGLKNLRRVADEYARK